MTPKRLGRHQGESALVALMVVQITCAFLFMLDIVGDVQDRQPGDTIGWHLTIELSANLALILAIIIEALYLKRLLAQHARNEIALSAARGALDDLMQAYFSHWHLTPAETDVATFVIKGFSIAEIAGLRQSAEGTIKSQLNAIYRKSGLTGRSQLVSLLIEDLLHSPIGGVKPANPGADIANGAGADGKS
jgi:DNA-binding NarL/FixJ family response regulator